jgi:hypothetical protein
MRNLTQPILGEQELFRIKESLTLDSPEKLDSNHHDSEAVWGSSEAV